MTSPTDGQLRPELGELLHKPTTPAALLETVRLRMIGARQRENRAPETTAAVMRERLPELAAELVGLKVDLIVVTGGPILSAAKKATSTITIVMTNAADPVAASSGEPSRAPSAWVKNRSPEKSASSVRPNRSSARSRRVSRTESATTSAPSNTALPTAAPSSAPKWARAWKRRLRSTREEIFTRLIWRSSKFKAQSSREYPSTKFQLGLFGAWALELLLSFEL